jgi:maltooligosyltrehalose trehalohydrolase
MYFTDHQDPVLAAAVRDGRRAEFKAFGWQPDQVPDPQDPSTVLRSVLDWSELDRPAHADMLAWYRALLALRRRSPELRDGRFDHLGVEADEAGRTLILRRATTVVAANFARSPRTLAVEATSVLLSSSDVDVRGAEVTLPPESVAILTRG